MVDWSTIPDVDGLGFPGKVNNADCRSGHVWAPTALFLAICSGRGKKITFIDLSLFKNRSRVSSKITSSVLMNRSLIASSISHPSFEVVHYTFTKVRTAGE